MKATKEQIIAEANRRHAEQGEGAPPVEHFIVDVVCENWTPPEPVDPDILAFREWAARNANWTTGWQASAYQDGRLDNTNYAQAYLAGARTAREQERERAKVLVSELENLADAEQADQDAIRDIALAALAKYEEGGR